MARVCMVLFNNYVMDPRVRREAEALAERGDSVDCVCLCQGEVKELNGVRLFYLTAIKYRGNSLLFLLLQYIQFFCYAFIKISIEHLRNPYQIVQAHTMPDFLIFVGLVPKLFGAKLVLDIHDLMPELYVSKWGSDRNTWIIAAITWIERRSVAFADRTIAVSKPHLDALVSHGNPREKFSIVLNVPDDRIFTNRKRVNTARGRFTLFYHGTVPKRAGLDVALRALARVREEIPGVRMKIRGHGECVEELRAFTAELGLAEIVEWLPVVPIDQLPSVFAEVDVGVVPYTADAFTRYVLPTKLLEYAATGVPALVTRLPAVQTYFDSSMVSYFESGNDVDLAEQILNLYRNPDRRKQMAMRALHFTEKYNWPQQRQVYFGLIDSLVSDRRVLVKANSKG
jgi:glycosyltransferase involved in cell wall biosynthesis